MTTSIKPAPEAKTTRGVLGKGYLSDEWVREGESIEEFFEILKALDAVTKFQRVFLKDIVLCSPELYESDAVTFRAYTQPENVGRRVRQEKLAAADLDHVYTEMAIHKSCLLWQGGSTPAYFTRTKALRELMGALGLSGPVIDVQSAARDAYIADLISKTPAKQQVTLVCRKEGEGGNEAEKVFSVRTGKYTPIELAEIEDLFNEITALDMGAIKCIGWKIDHDYASIDLLFPDATQEFKELCGLREDIQAGVRLQSSGTGYSCFTAKELWMVGSVISEHACVKNKHVGKWVPEDFVQEVKENIFDEYGVLPERLCELFSIPIVSTETVASSNLKTAEKILFNAVSECFKHINLSKAFKMESSEDETVEKKRSYIRILTEKLTEHFSIMIQTALRDGESCEITAYDLALAVMELPNTVTGIPKSYMVAFANACGKAAYYPFKEGDKYLVKKPDISIVA